MAELKKRGEQHFEDHPKFPGVRICKLAGSFSKAPAGISILEIAPGVEIPVHIHEESMDAILVLEGSGSAYVNGAWSPIEKGDFAMIPAGQEHGVRNDSDSPMRLYVVHQPPLF